MSLALLLAAVLAPAPGAPPEDAPLRWVADPAACPSGAQVRSAVVELAGRWPRRDELEVDGFVQGQGERWTLVLTVVVAGQVHRQTLEAESCGSLARAAALIVAVSVDPVASAGSVPVPIEAPTPPSEALGPTEETPAPRAREPDREPAQRRARPFAGLGWGVVLGMTPGVSSGPSLRVGADFERARVAVLGRYVLPRTALQAGAGARVQAGTVGARACLSSRPGPLRGHLCGGAEGGVIRAGGLGFDAPSTQHYPWLAGVIGGGLRWSGGRRWALTADLEGAVAVFDAQIVRGPADADPLDIVYENPRLSVRALVGVDFEVFRP